MPLRLLTLLLLFVVPSAWAQVPEVRVLLDRLSQPVQYQVVGAHSGYVGHRLAFETPLGITWPLAARDGLLIVDGIALGESLTIAPQSGEVAWSNSHFRGMLRFLADGDDLLVVNVLDVENYLRGVVPSEMMARWPMESLKAQAVASRTYTLDSLDPSLPFDVCATVECQVYLGMEAEDPRSDQAISETFGLVLTYQNDLARTYYHSDSGGAIASSAEVWGTPLPYLPARTDVTASTPHRGWRQTLDPQRLGLLLEGMGISVGTVTAIQITSYSDSGRALAARIIGSAGSTRLTGSRLTSFLRDAGLKSTRVTMLGDLVARGDGWGHGVGMSQYGARQLALAGYRFDEILSFYYPQTTLQPIVQQTALERDR